MADEEIVKAKKPRKPGVKRTPPAGGTQALEDYREEQAKAKRVVMGKYDWERARELFISAEPAISLKQLATDLNMSYPYMRQKAAQERWNYLRVEEQRRLFKKRREETARKNLEKAMRFDEASIATATLGQTLVMARLSEIAELHAATKSAMSQTIANIRAGMPVRKEDLYSAIRFTELKELGLAAKLFQDMGRMAFGIDSTSLEEQAGDGSIENVISVSAELGKDDPRRLAAMLEAFERAGLVSVNMLTDDDDEEDGEVVEGEVMDRPDIGTDYEPMKEITAT